MKKLTQYIKDGFSLRTAPNDTWMVYTPSTGNFVIESLDELTPDRFDKAIDVFKNSVTQGGTLAGMYSDLTKEAPAVTKYEDLVAKREQENNF